MMIGACRLTLHPKLAMGQGNCLPQEGGGRELERLTFLEGGGVLPYVSYTGTCCWIGCGFWPLCPEQGI